MKQDFKKLIFASILRKAKDLSDEEILSLYHSIKEKLDNKSKPGEQALPDSPGPEPMETENTGLPTQEEQDSENDASIDDLLKDLGLDGDTDVKPTNTEDSSSLQAPASEPEPAQEIKATAELPEIPEITTGQENIVTEFDDERTESMIERLTERLLEQDEFSPDKFISASLTAAKGQQTCRKDKDLMADGITKPKFSEGEGIRPPRLDERDPNAERYKKNNENRDPEIDNDKDLKLSSVDWNQYISSTPDSGGEYYGMYLPIGVEPPKVGEHLVLGGKNVVVSTVKTPEDIARGRGGPIANKMRENGKAFHVNCLPEGHEWLNPK